MKIGFIGFGKSVHRYHMPFVDKVENIEVVGYYTRGNSTFEMPYPGTEHLKRFATVEELLASEADLIVVCTSVLHYEFSKQALESGKHVLCEKPLCNTLEQANELYKIAKQNKLLLSPYQNRRFDTDFVSVFEQIESGKLGQVAEIISNHTQDRFVASNQKSNKYNGMVYGHAVHFLDQIVSKYGQPEDVVYDITNQRDFLYGGTGDIDDYYHIQLIYNNLRVGVNFNAIAVKAPPRFVVYGSTATLEKYGIDCQEYYLKQGRYLDDPEFGFIPKSEYPVIYNRDGRIDTIEVENKDYTQFYQLIQDAVDNKGSMPVSEHEAKVVINIMETMVEGREYKKLKTGDNMEKILNFRLLAEDLVNKEGKKIKNIYRSADVSSASASDIDYLCKLGITDIIDLRSDEEITNLIDSDDITVTNIDIIGNGKQNDVGKIAVPDLAELMIDLYQNQFVATNGFTTELNHILNLDGSPFLFHCTAGKDRTGITGAILMHILGFSYEDIKREYLKIDDELVNVIMAKVMEQLEGHQMTIDKEVLLAIASVSESFLEAFLLGITDEYGTIDKYVETKLQINEQTIESLKSFYLE